MTALTLVTAAERPELAPDMRSLGASPWPEFLDHDTVVNGSRGDGLPFDPWIRVHERVGGEILGPASAAMRVTGPVADWERWTGMAMPESGPYVVPGALVNVEVDRERDIGEYVEPACWVRHRL